MVTLVAPNGETLAMKSNARSSGAQFKLDLRIGGFDRPLTGSAWLPGPHTRPHDAWRLAWQRSGRDLTADDAPELLSLQSAASI
jgi:hypothetical protein